ncbi:MAG: mechanosensitive ion channel protein MscS [Ectothiorhodospiraceae bacterium]|nr:mechanosensitive ion channel protein MscS [Ectothiorhodospiraceae bacterium]
MRFRTYRPERILWSLILLFALSGSGIAQKSENILDLSSPRAAFETYLVAMVNYGNAERPTQRSRFMKRAVQCFDLSGVAVNIREDVGPRFAIELKIFLDKYEIVDLDEIPESYTREKYVWRKPVSGTEVSLVLLEEDSSWVFSYATIKSLPELLELVEDREFVEGVESTVEVKSFADWVRARMPEQLKQRAVLLENWQWIALLLIVIIGVIIERVFTFFAISWIAKAFKRATKDKNVKFKFGESYLRPLGILIMAYFWSATLPLLGLAVDILNVLFFAAQVVIAVAGVWTAYRAVDVVASAFASIAERTPTKFDDLLVRMVRRVLKILVIAFGVLFVADNLDIDITSLLAGVGIGGIALALAAKDTVENLFGSVTVLVDRPFEIGDWIKVGDLEGTVEDVGFRSTRIRTFYNSVLVMPNSHLVNASVDNMGKRRYRRISAMLGVQYDTPPDKIDAFCEGIRVLIRNHPYTRKDFYLVYLNEFADFSLNIKLYTFHETPDWPTELRERHRLFVDIIRLAKRLGVEFAFPTQTIHISSMPVDERTMKEEMSSKPEETRAPDEYDSSIVDDSITIGAKEAEAILKGQWGEGVQPGVSFTDADSVKPGRAKN